MLAVRSWHSEMTALLIWYAHFAPFLHSQFGSEQGNLVLFSFLSMSCKGVLSFVHSQSHQFLEIGTHGHCGVLGTIVLLHRIRL